MGTFLGWLAISAGLVGGMFVCAEWRRRWRGEAAVVGLAVGAAFLWGAFPVVLHAVVTFVASAACAGYRGRWPIAAAVSLAAMAWIYGTTGVTAYERFEVRRELREKYPLVSLSARLAYEGTPKVPLPVEPGPTRSVYDGSLEWHEIDAQGEQALPSNRRMQLQRLHRGVTDEFKTAAGFGADRMTGFYVRDYHLELPANEPLKLAMAEPPPDTSAAAHLANEPLAGRPLPHLLDELHTRSFWDFLDPERIGYVRDRDHVAGFVPHRLTSRPKVIGGRSRPARAGKGERGNEEWRVTRLELVSLLRHATPVAYVSEHLPRMDELVDAPTRPLRPFEAAALARLQDDEELVVQDEGEPMLMLGALRAARECQACHNVERHALLGAFSYELTTTLRTKSSPRPPSQHAAY